MNQCINHITLNSQRYLFSCLSGYKNVLCWIFLTSDAYIFEGVATDRTKPRSNEAHLLMMVILQEVLIVNQSTALPQFMIFVVSCFLPFMSLTRSGYC